MKTRFAPSPTGYIHIGNVRSAIYPYLLAKQENGTFILRIEDTDQARFVEGATELIEETLRWLGLDWDEGPEVGGENGPYFQQERKAIYLEWAKKLMAQGRAYADATPGEKVQEYRDLDNAAKVPYLYRNHRPEGLEGAVEALRSAAGSSDALREGVGSSVGLRDEEMLQGGVGAGEVLRGGAQPSDTLHDGTESGEVEKFFQYQEGVPVRFYADPKPRQWTDEVMGEMEAGPEVQDDIILIKADGLPTYNFAHIIDDMLMGVTYVIRGVEYLPSTPNYLALYEALEIERPRLVSLPHILAPTGNKKLGKRDGAKSVTEYREDGVLAEAMLNYLANLGWNDGTEQEIYTKDELIQRFALDRVQKSGARYDEKKLYWMNGQWIRKIATGQRTVSGAATDLEAVATEAGIDELYARTEGFWPEAAVAESEEYRKKVLGIVYDRLKVLADLREMTDYFFVEPEVRTEMMLENKFLKKLAENELVELLQRVAARLDGVTDWTADALQGELNALLEETGKKPAELFSVIRIALSYAPFSPALNLTMEVLGKERSLARIRRAANALAQG